GSAFGERALLAEEKRSMSIQALSACTCWYLDRATFIELMGPLEEVVRWTLLRQEPMMSCLVDREVATLMKKIVLKHIAPGEVIFKTGDVADSFQIIEDGNVAIVDDLPAFMKEFNEDCAMGAFCILSPEGPAAFPWPPPCVPPLPAWRGVLNACGDHASACGPRSTRKLLVEWKVGHGAPASSWWSG
ncbi:hypothetical protein CYMTET_26267, partial [Cymbomonas tetramitiformis]